MFCEGGRVVLVGEGCCDSALAAAAAAAAAAVPVKVRVESITTTGLDAGVIQENSLRRMFMGPHEKGPLGSSISVEGWDARWRDSLFGRPAGLVLLYMLQGSSGNVVYTCQATWACSDETGLAS